MTASQLFYAGRLSEAIRVQEAVVGQRPLEPEARLLLAELHLFNGELNAVRKQLDAFPREPPGMEEYLRGYRMLIDAEASRQRLLIDADPNFLSEPPEHIAARLQALEHLRANRQADAVETLDEADSMCPWIAGHIDGREFDGVRDVDDLFGPVLELIVEDRYVWFPLDEIRRLRLSQPESLRDQYFRPAHLTSIHRDEWDVYLPMLYPGSHRHEDEEIRVGLGTDWVMATDGPSLGIGIHELSFGEEVLTPFDFTQWECRA